MTSDIYVWSAPRDLDADAAQELIRDWEAAGGDPAASPFEPSTDVGWFHRELMKDHPRIEYRLTEMTLKEAPKSADAPFLFDSKGELSVAGVTNKIQMPVSMTRVEKDKLKFTGSTSVKMTSFGIEPPKLIGILSTGDDVKITFEWLAAKKEETK